MKNINAVLDTDEKHMTIDGVLHSVIDHRSFDDFGGTLESFKVMDVMANVRVVYSNDDALTFFADEFPPELKQDSECGRVIHRAGQSFAEAGYNNFC